MYESFYNFREKPFSLTPDPKYLYFSKHHQGAMDHMLYGIREREGFIVIMGGIGAGKTTLSRCLLNRLDKNVQVALIINPMLSDMDLLRTLVHDLRVKPCAEKMEVSRPRRIDDVDGAEFRTVQVKNRTTPPANWYNRATKKELLDALNQFLLDQYSRGGSTVVIIDEAQNLSLDVMEELRLLSNLETDKEKLLQIIFVGQKELEEKLKLPELKQLRQRISIQYELQPLSPEETQNYVEHRIHVACGTSRASFSAKAVREIHNYSKGYPRLINLVCDRALLAGFNDKTDTIGAGHVRKGIRSLLGEEGRDFFLKRFFKERFPLAVSMLFFLAGLVFFVVGGKGGLPRLQTWVETQWEQIMDRASGRKAAAAAVQPSKKTVPALPAPPVAGEEETVVPVQEPENPVIAGEEPRVSVLAPEASGGNYRIQVHTSKKRSEAEGLVEELGQQGYTAFLKEVTSTGRPWYVVYVGPYEALEQARIHLNSLKFSGRTPILLSISRSG